MRPMRRMRLAVIAAGRRACHMRYHLPQSRRQRGIRPQNSGAQRQKPTQYIRPMRHNFQTIWLKPHCGRGQRQFIGKLRQLRGFGIFKCAICASYYSLYVSLFLT